MLYRDCVMGFDEKGKPVPSAQVRHLPVVITDKPIMTKKLPGSNRKIRPRRVSPERARAILAQERAGVLLRKPLTFGC